MDEFTPECLFKSKNHNWFGWQFGYAIKDLGLKNSELQIEYNWTDQRIYMHKYDINDFYNHQHPLGFWAGPHAEELLFYYQNYSNEIITRSKTLELRNKMNLVKSNSINNSNLFFAYYVNNIRLIDNV